MNKYGKKLLSALLVIAMMASLLIVPAAAAGVGTKWDFLNDGTAEGFTGDAFEGVTVDGTYLANYGAQLSNTKTIVFPVDGPCDINVHVKHNWKIWINDDTDNTDEWSAGSGDKVVTFHYNGKAGNVTLNTGTMSWVADIELTQYTAAVASLELNMDAVTLKVGEDAATVTATVKNGAATDWEVVSDSESVATAEVADGMVSITPVGEGTATVTVKATVDGVDDPLTADITVTVDPAGAYTAWDFTGADFQASAPASYKGLTISGGKAGGAANGVAFFSADNASIEIPVDGPCTILVVTFFNWDLQLGDDETTRDTAAGDGSGSKTVEFSYTGEAGTATVKALNGRTWIKSIELQYGGGGEEPDPGEEPEEPGDDTATIAAGEYIFDGKNAYGTDDAVAKIAGLDVGELKIQDNTGSNNHGLVIASGDTITLNLGEGKATLTVFTCTWGAGTNMGMTSSSGKTATPTTDTNSMNETAPKFVVEEATGKTTLTFTSSDNKGSWLHSLKVEYAQAPTPPVASADKRIGVWDIAGKLETDTSLYTNHITPATWGNWASTLTGDALAFAKGGETVTVKGNDYKTKGGEIPDFQTIGIDLDGLVLYTANASSSQCSIFSTVTSDDWGNFKPQSGSLVTTFADGYTSAGGYMTYGNGGGNRRYITITGVKAGETVVAYLGNNQYDTTYVVDGVDATLTLAKNAYGTLSFIAPKDGSYKIYEPDAKGGKPAYLRVMVVPPVTVSGSITLPGGFNATGWGLKFVDPETKAETKATVNDDNTYTVELAPGHTYNASLTSANGWGMTVATKQVTPAQGDITTGKTHNLAVEKKEQYTYSGTITGFAAGYDTSKLAITMVPDADAKANAGADDVDLTLTGMNFTAVLDPSVVYTLELKGVNDYAIKTPAEVTSEGVDLTGQSIVVEAKALVAASGKFVTLDVDDQFAPLKADSTYAPLTATVTALSFENVDDGYTYAATVKDGGYTVNLRAGAYLAKATVNGYATKTHVVVGDKAVSKDLLFVSTATPAGVDYAADVYVDGKGGSDLHFKTVTGAMAYIKRMTRTDAQRVTVHITPGTYTEQISIDSKNVTFVNDTPSKEVKLTWYYGIGYTYYSASNDGWYDAELAFDRYSKTGADVARWGATVRVQASGFQAENITFENSFNRYLTDEELLDGVEFNGKQNIRFVREYGADVTSKTATERAAALWVDTNNGRGDMTEFKSCKFFSSQDTLGTGKRMYFKDCYIEGMTDYICGPGDCVFDTCTLNWKGYSDTATSGYVTAPQTGAGEKGYFFRNCYISGDTKLKVSAGALGRTWGAADTKCIFLNTALQSADVISNTTWGEMQGFDPKNSTTLLEWGTTLADGTAVDLTKRTQQNTVAKTQPTAKPTDYFAGWDPEYYVEEAATVAFETDPYITDNGDINLPYPGHTLTVNYSLGTANDANDNSTIQWYRVKDGAETLVKTSSAVAGKTYQIQAADVGAQIKVTVTPTTLSGKTGEAKSMTVAETVKEGYDDPSNPVDPELGDGVNIFLAGDSTVKHYGAVGMHQSGKIGKEGSWGEFFQEYFDNSKVTVVNYANGGRSTRNFINEGTLDKIAAVITEGDYLFIQFGHNDCADGASYIDDRYAPLGTPDANGVYPSTPGVKGSDGKYTWDCGGTYKWYLQQYIDTAKAKGAIPVLITPVARMYYTTDGAIRPHHDDSKTSNNAYCTAVKQLAQEQNVLLIDGYALTEKMFVDAYKAGGNDTYGKQTMAVGDATHSNKLGGMIEAALIAQTVQGMELNISKTVQAPSQVLGKTDKGETAFTVDGQSKFAAYDMLQDYAEHATYWEGVGQKLFDDIAAKAAQLNGGTTTPEDPEDPNTPVDPAKPADKTALSAAITAAEKAIPTGIYVVGDDTKVSEVNRGTKFMTESDKAAYDKALAAAKALLAKDDATQAEVDAAVKALNEAAGKVQTGTKSTTSGNGGSGGSSGRPSGSGSSGSTTTNANGDTVKKTANSQGDTVITVTAPNGEELVKVTLPATISAADTKFVDVPDDHWAAKAINTMAALGMVKGVSENTYDMVSPMTRGAIATVLYRLSNGTEGKTTSFADVAENAWYADAVGWAAATGVVNGYSDTAFGPDDTITRQQLAVMLARYAKLLGMDTAAELTALDSFADGATVGTWAADDMAWCVQKGILKGRGNGVLDPTADVTRAEAAVMLDRMLDLIK